MAAAGVESYQQQPRFDTLAGGELGKFRTFNAPPDSNNILAGRMNSLASNAAASLSPHNQ